MRHSSSSVVATLLVCTSSVSLLLAQTGGPVQIIPGTGQQPVAVEKKPVQTIDAGLALTPPMGWNSWNKFGCNVDEDLIRNTADALAGSGMRDAGYQYLVIDDCWHGARDAHGDIQPDLKRFPSGIKVLADYVHGKGLKFGIYSDAGSRTCAGRPGSRGYEFQDAAQYAAWGVDYLKYDWCNTSTQDGRASYTTMREALNHTGRPIIFSMCEWGTAKPWLWAKGVGNLYRTTGDIYDHWDGKRDYSLGVMTIVDLNEPLWPFAGPGHWNDPDMLEVGNGGMTEEEYRTHFSLWAMMAAPLIAGNDVAHMTPQTRSILMNKEIIALDQDSLGRPGHRIRKQGDLEVWTRELAGGNRAVLLLNRGAAPVDAAFTWDDLGYSGRLPATVKNLWSGATSSRQAGTYLARAIPSHSVVVLKVSP